jgi:hypothetical protein
MKAIRNFIGSKKHTEGRLPSKSLLVPATLILAALIAASLACNMPGFRQSPDAQLDPIPVTTQAAGQLEDDIEGAAEDLLNGRPFTLTIHEAQLTSAANLELRALQEAQVQNLQIYLRDGQVKMFGDVIRDGLTLPFSISVRVYALNGNVAYEILDAKVGPIPLPQSILDELEAQLDQFILAQLGSGTAGVVIQQVSIANGVMTISGHARG